MKCVDIHRNSGGEGGTLDLFWAGKPAAAKAVTDGDRAFEISGPGDVENRPRRRCHFDAPHDQSLVRGEVGAMQPDARHAVGPPAA